MKSRALLLGLLLGVVGCPQAEPTPPQAETPKKTETPKSKPSEPVDPEVAAERAKLSAEDKVLVDAQEWCVISTDERLGSMGAPIKLMIKDQAVFICCKGCKRKAEANPDETLAKVAELKAKKKKEANP